MPTLSQLITDRAEADIQIGAGALHVVYRPGAISPAMAHRMAEVNRVADSATEEQVLARIDSLVDVLAPILTAWDLEEENGDGTPSGRIIPVTHATLAETGLAVLGAIYSGILIASQPDPTKASASPPRALATSARGRNTTSKTSDSKPSRKN